MTAATTAAAAALLLAVPTTALWPIAAIQEGISGAVPIDPVPGSATEFSFQLTGELQGSVILYNAISRYQKYLWYNGRSWPVPEGGEILRGINLTIAGTQASFDVEALRTAAPGAKEWAANELKSSNLADIPPCPYLRVDESYELLTTVPYGKLSANSTWGFLRGLETLAQHSYFDPDRNLYTMSGVNVTDGPRFGVRGMLVDTARHYLPMSTLYAAFDSVAMHKMNTIHLHLTDDQTTPWIPDGHPELKKGNWGKLGNHYYSNADMRSLAKFAAFRGLAINVEIDGPGHMTAFRYGCPECIICGNKTGQGGLANVLPGSAYWDLMQDMYAQLAEIMPWGMIGLGGDEVSSQECWSKNSSIVQLAEDLNVTIGGAGPDSLMCWFHAQRLEMAEALGMQAVFWSDAAGCTNLPHVNISDPSALALAAHPKPTWETVRASAGGRLPAVMDVWRMDEYVLPQVLQRGFPAVVSSMCEYLNCSWNTEYWQNLYCDPTNTSQPVDPALMDALMLGAHASRWGEDTDATNWMANVWPAASGTAEKLWSPKDKTTPEGEGKLDPMERLRDFRCLLGTRGLPIPPIMIDHCPVPYDNGYQPLGWDEL